MDVQQVGNQFVRVYYETLIEAPMTLLSLYKSESTCSTGDKSKVISHNGLEVCNILFFHSLFTKNIDFSHTSFLSSKITGNQ